MTKKTFVLVSLEDPKSKEIANAISNATAKRILDYLGSKEESSAGEISKELKIPLATVEYNLEILLKSGLLESPEFKWSEKGKKVNLYQVAKKLIVIAPKGTESLASKLSGLLPAFLATIIGSIVIYSYQKFSSGPNIMMKASEAAPSLSMRATDNVTLSQPIATANPLLYFILGASLAFVSIILYSCYAYWRSRK